MAYVPPPVLKDRAYEFSMRLSFDSLDELAAILREVQERLALGRTEICESGGDGSFSIWDTHSSVGNALQSLHLDDS